MGDAKKRSKPKKKNVGHQSSKLPKYKEEGYDHWTKTLKTDILKHYRTDTYNVTDLVRLRTRREKELAKLKKDKK